MKESIKAKITFGKVMKFIGYALIAAVYILIFGRIYLADNHGIMDRFSFDESTASLYTEQTEFLTQTISTSMDAKGYFKISNLVYIPEHGELQINVRYNDSTLDALNSYYSEVSENGLDSFVFVISDSSELVIKEYEYIPRSNLLYNFRKLKFENIKLDSTDKLYLTVYPSNDISENSPMTVTFTIYDKDIEMRKSDLKVKYGSKPDIFTKSIDFEIGKTTEES